MIRAFIGLELPEEVRDRLEQVQSSLPLPRVIASENLHLTLVFLGSQPEPVLAELHDALSALRAPGFELTLSGLATFGGARPRNVHVGVRPEPALDHLQSKVENAARRADIHLPARRFVPHVTLARIGTGRIDRPRLERAVAGGLDFTFGPFPVDQFTLFRSHLHSAGADYEALARYDLQAR